MTTPAEPPAVTLSIVSHGQGRLVRHLLDDLRAGIGASFEILLTLNVAEDESFIQPFSDLPLRVVRNAVPKGFGANHNAAFDLARGRYFAVVNPDVRARPLQVGPLIETLVPEGIGACGPAVYTSDDRIEDSARRFPSLWRLIRRVLLRLRHPEYRWGTGPIDVDWLAGIFILFRREAFAAVSGFDERYFMYFEDTDICHRLHVKGWRVRLDPRSRIVHEAQRASHRKLQHMRWHLASAVRYLTRA